MYSIQYKGWYIQGDFDDKKIEVVSPTKQVFRVKSVYAGKLLITRKIKEYKNALESDC